ncbi:hypothetical protein [Labrys miyagiensis]
MVPQIGQDEAVGNTPPGGLYVLMRHEDRLARRFDRAWIFYEQD